MKKLKLKGQILIIILFLLIPIVLKDPYSLNILVLFGVFCLLALSVNIVVGYIGELTLGHAAFFGLGAYTSAILAKDLGLPFFLAAIGAVLISGMVGFGVGYLSLRLQGAYFAIVTLAFAEIMKLIINNWVDLTRGPMGLTQIPCPVIKIPGLFTLEINNEFSYYYLTLILVVISVLIIYRLVNSPTGRAFVAIREQEHLASSIGINAFNYKVLAFTISTMIAGLAGSTYAHHFLIISPDILGIYYSSIALLMVFVGGRGTLYGPLVGALLFTVLPETLRMAGNMRMIIFATLLLITITFMPEGIILKVQELAGKITSKKEVAN